MSILSMVYIHLFIFIIFIFQKKPVLDWVGLNI